MVPFEGREAAAGAIAETGNRMSEANQYMLGSVDRLNEHVSRESIYAPALVVLANEQVPEVARDYVNRILDGERLHWDLPPLAEEGWEVYAGICGFYAQLLRLLCRDETIDVWAGWRRTAWLSCDWHPLSRDFAWKIASRPIGGVEFRDDQPEMPEATRYLASWPHGWLRREECEAYAPYLHRRLCELAIEIGLDWELETLEQRLGEPEQLDREERFEINNLCAGRPGMDVWQFQRGFVLYEAMLRSIDRDQDLISVGY